jgi:hypothetical protein
MKKLSIISSIITLYPKTFSIEPLGITFGFMKAQWHNANNVVAFTAFSMTTLDLVIFWKMTLGLMTLSLMAT